MSSTQEDSILDFDLAFLHHTSNSTGQLSKLERQRRSVVLVKKKIIATNSLIGKYYAKRQELEESEKNLLDSKEECKQICIDYRNALETCAKLESEVVLIQNANKQLEEKCFHSETQYEAIKSHANQLQGLANEKQTQIETLQIENRLEKAASKENERKALSLKKKNEILRKNILIFRDIILKKKTLNDKYKQLLRKFDKPFNLNENDDACLGGGDHLDGGDHYEGGSDTDIEDDIFEDVMSPGSAPRSPQNNISEVKKSLDVVKHIQSTDLDNTEVVSVDTGRGSSLAFSDNEKCFHSPEYYANDSPLNRETIEHKINTEEITIPKSQSPMIKTVEVATSPINVGNDSLLCQITFEEDSNDVPEILQKPLIISNETVSYINPFNYKGSISKSPFKSICNGLTSPVKVCGTANDIKLQNKTGEKTCLEINKKADTYDENTNDYEIATILDTMRLRHKLITPIPNSPAKCWGTEPTQPLYDNCKQVEQNGKYVCQDSVLVKEENRKLQNSINDLAREIINIKSLLKSHIFCDKKLSSSDNGATLNQALVDNNDEPDVNMTQEEKCHTIPADDEDTILCFPMVEDCPTSVDRGMETLYTQPVLASTKLPPLSMSPNALSIQSIESSTTRLTPKLPKSTSIPVSPKVLSIHPVEFSTKLTPMSPKSIQPVESSTKLTPIPVSPKVLSIHPVEFSTELTPTKTPEALSMQSVESSKTELTPMSLSPNELSRKPCVESSSEPTASLPSILSIQPEETESSELVVEKKVSPTVSPLANEKSKQNYPKVFLQRLLFEDSMPLPDVDDDNDADSLLVDSVAVSDNMTVNCSKDLNNEPKIDNHDKIKHKKLTSLQKLKKKLGPKYKIKTDKLTSPRKLRMATKNHLPPKKTPTPSDTSASLNDKNVYEKAVKVMAELKSKQLNIKHSEGPKAKVSRTVDSSESPLANNLDSEPKSSCSPRSIKTRSWKKCIEQLEGSPVKPTNTEPDRITDITNSHTKPEVIMPITPRITRKRRTQSSTENSEVQPKRLLRSSTSQQANTPDTANLKNESRFLAQIQSRKDKKPKIVSPSVSTADDVSNKPSAPPATRAGDEISYGDIEMFSPDNDCPPSSDYSSVKTDRTVRVSPKESLLCSMIDKYGVLKMKYEAKKAPDLTIKTIYERIDSDIARIIELPCSETKQEMDNLVAHIKTLNYRHFMTALMQYLTQSERKTELFAKVNLTPAPPMTKPEQILLYVIIQVRSFWPSVDFADAVLCSIEYTLFKLNRTPEFDVIESISHFYAILCRYFKAKSRLRLFILDAMYCIQFKSVPLIKQCLDVWMHIIPLAHMGIAKSPLVTCLVYLLHFYKCEDRFNRVQELRNILHRKYFYQITEWNETKMLDMVRQAILDLKDVAVERKMLRMALIILAKRQGTRWCQNQAIKNVITPFIEKDDVPEKVKVFCISMIGPLMKPYPIDMKVHTEIAMNQLISTLKGNVSARMEEAIITSLVYMSKHNQNRVSGLLLTRKMDTPSTELEDILRDYVREKPLKVWKGIVKKLRFTLNVEV